MMIGHTRGMARSIVTMLKYIWSSMYIKYPQSITLSKKEIVWVKEMDG